MKLKFGDVLREDNYQPLHWTYGESTFGAGFQFTRIFKDEEGEGIEVHIYEPDMIAQDYRLFATLVLEDGIMWKWKQGGDPVVETANGELDIAEYPYPDVSERTSADTNIVESS